MLERGRGRRRRSVWSCGGRGVYGVKRERAYYEATNENLRLYISILGFRRCWRLYQMGSLRMCMLFFLDEVNHFITRHRSNFSKNTSILSYMPGRLDKSEDSEIHQSTASQPEQTHLRAKRQKSKKIAATYIRIQRSSQIKSKT